MMALGYLIGWFFVFAIAAGVIFGIKAAIKFPVPKGLSNREIEDYYKTVPPFGNKMPLPQILDAKKLEEALTKNNEAGIIYEEFKAFGKKRFVVTTEGLVYGEKIIPYEYLSFVSIIYPPSPLTCGIAEILINGKRTLLGYKFRDRHRAKMALDYVNTVANPDQPWPESLMYWEADIEKLEYDK